MSLCPESEAKILDSRHFLDALLAAPRPGSEKILAFYDHRVGHISTDPRLLMIPLDDHMCHRGDGLFESICYRQGRIFALDAHLARMEDGAKALTLKPPLSFARIGELICQTARAGGQEHGDLRVFLSRGPGGFGVSPSECPQGGLYIVALKDKLPEPELYKRGLSAFASAYPPKQDYLARIKNTNYLPNVFMAQEASRKHMDVAITFDADGCMGEAAIANVAIVDENGALLSPPLKNILPGTTLLAALELAAERMPVYQRPIHKTDIYKAKEMLLLTSATLCVPICSFDGKAIGDGKPGPLAQWLKDALLDFMLANGKPF